MSPRLLLCLPLLALAGCTNSSNTSVATTPATSVANLPRHRQLAEAKAASSAELARPVPKLSDLLPPTSTNIQAPRSGTLAAKYIASLTDPGPTRGLIICEPQGTQAKDLAAGCARWMSVMGAGTTSFDVVPTWATPTMFLRTKGWSDMRLELGRAAQLAQGMDASHVAIGTFDGRGLQYQVISVQGDASTVVGSFSIKGSPDQIVAQLPALTRQLVAATGVKGAQIPASVGLGAKDLTFLGSLPRDPELFEKITPTQLSSLSRLVTQPLAAIYLGRIDATSLPVFTQAAKTLLAIAPTNALAASEVARKFSGVEEERRTQVLQALERKFPHNQAIALGNAWLRRQEGDYFAEVQDSERAVRITPNSAVTWHELSAALGNQADEKRQGAYWADMSKDEQAFVLQIYPKAQAAAWKAVDLDPADSDNWTQLSAAATMNNNDDWAYEALSQALKIDPSNEDALNWGLEIFQPKWGGTADSFATMARFAVAHAGRGHLDVFTLCDGLKRTSQETLKRPLLQKLVTKDPNNVAALREYSYATRMELGDPKAALPYARRAVQLAPDNTRCLTELADIEQHDFGQYLESIKLFRHAIQLEPKNPLHWVNMALSYAKWGKKAEARTYAIKGHKLGYRGPHPVWNLVGLGPDGSEPQPTQPPSPPMVAH